MGGGSKPDVPEREPNDDDVEVTEATRIGGALVGHYRTGAPLGSGGMANVFEAVDVRTGERVALKVLHESYREVSEVASRFTREGRALRNMSHPNIVRVIDQGLTDEGDAWIAMELLQGGSLRALVEKKGPLDPQRALRLFTDVANALAAVHEKGIVHRDVKPDNVFVVDEGLPTEQAKLIDFGVAQLTQAEIGEYSVRHTHAGSLLGSAAFMSPEQLAGGTVDARSDVFGFGVSLYETLTGALPFAGDSLVEQLRARSRSVITPITKHLAARAIDPNIDVLIRRCLSGDPAERPQNGLALSEELLAIQSAMEATMLAEAAPPSTRSPVSVRVLPEALAPSSADAAPPSARSPISVRAVPEGRAPLAPSSSADVNAKLSLPPRVAIVVISVASLAILILLYLLIAR